MCGLYGPSAQVCGGVQGLQQRQVLSEEPPGPVTGRPPPPAQRSHQTDEESGLRQRIQIQPRLQRTGGARISPRGAARRQLLYLDAAESMTDVFKCVNQ